MTRHRRLLALAAALLGAGAAAAQPAADRAVWSQRLDAVITSGYDRPSEAFDALDTMQRRGEAPSRAIVLARGLVAARAGLETPARGAIAELARRSADDPLAAADARLVQAALADAGNRNDEVAAEAGAAAERYAALCSTVAMNAGCDPLARWRALLLAHGTAQLSGNRIAARDLMRQVLDAASAAGDVGRQASAHASLAVTNARLGELDASRRHWIQATRLLALDPAPARALRLKMTESSLAAAHDDPAGALRAAEQALPLSREAGSPRLAAALHAQLSDVYVKAGRPRDALRMVELALPVYRRFGDRRGERVLLHNAGLARIALGQVAEGRRDLERLIELWGHSGAAGDQAMALREYGDALAAAGDAAGALELYHWERRVSAGIAAANRETALRALRTRYDREQQQRDIELLARDNALASAELANRTLLQWMWALIAAMLTLGLAVAVLLYRRVRETRRQLEHSHALLRVQSERDPLTGLANRRHFRDVMRTHAGHGGFDGALLLVDIDHFKQINDGRGHAVGDQALVETARRLMQAVREHDLVVRWGGEEFLVFAPRIAADQVDALAARILHAVAGEPVRVAGGPLGVTASVGYARCPLPPYSVSLTWEQAVNLADMALYTAKSQGRNRAVGITGCAAPDRAALAHVEADFERAWSDGRVSLRVTPGPVPAPA